jgi:hypothetical protein
MSTLINLKSQTLAQCISIVLSNIFLLFILSFIWGCENNVCPTCSDWDNSDNIHGSGQLVTTERELPSFHSIKHTTVGQVKLTYGETQEVLVTTDDNIYTYVKTDVVNGELIISIDAPKGLSNFDLTFDITIPEIRSLTTSSAGNIDGQNKFYGEKVNLLLSSAGNINLEIEADELHSNLYSAGNVFIKGSVNKHVVNLYSAGNLNAFSLSTDTTYITLNSAGSGNVNVANYLDATLNSAGSLYYMGNPEIVQRVSSVGRIYNAN